MLNKEATTRVEEIRSLFTCDTSIYNRLAEEIINRVDYLKDYLNKNKLKGFVLGISGGVDSALAGKLAQMACEQIYENGGDATFTAMRLPYGKQFDESDANRSLEFINPDVTLTVDIKESVDAMIGLCADKSLDPKVLDYHKGNIKARMRMVAQYYQAGVRRSAVIGTDHNSECIMGFFTKHGDGACDLLVLDGLSKNMIREMLRHLGAPTEVYQKAPTADLEDLNPGKLDDEGFGISYEDLTKFIEGGEVEESVLEKIVLNYESTQHKRLPTPTYMSSEIFTNRSHI